MPSKTNGAKSGGAREGAGRPMIGDKPKQKRSVMLLPADEELFIRLGGGSNLSAGLLEAARLIRARGPRKQQKGLTAR